MLPGMTVAMIRPVAITPGRQLVVIPMAHTVISWA
jgi:hypothetical protein